MISATGSEAGDSRSQRAADDRLLRDRGVPHAPLAETFVQARGRLEHAAGGADVLAEEDDPLVSRELVREGARHGLPVRELDHAYTSSNRVFRVRIRPGEGAFGRLADGLRHLGTDALELVRGDSATLREHALEERDRISLEPMFELAGRSVRTRVRSRVSLLSVGERLDQRRPISCPRPRHRSADDPPHLEDVVAVDLLGGHRVGAGSIGETIDRRRRRER